MFGIADTTASAHRAGCTRGERRKAEILEAARDLFLEKGYAGTSMEAVADRAGGSKETIYAYFGNKAGLMKAIIEEAGDALRQRLDESSDGLSIGAYLTNLGESYLDLILAPRSLALYRLIIAESARMPEIGDLFYRTCPEGFLSRLVQYFSQVAARGEIRSTEPAHLAAAFYGMLRGELHMRALFNPTRAPSKNEMRDQLRFVVSSILTLCMVQEDASAPCRLIG